MTGRSAGPTDARQKSDTDQTSEFNKISATQRGLFQNECHLQVHPIFGDFAVADDDFLVLNPG